MKRRDFLGWLAVLPFLRKLTWVDRRPVVVLSGNSIALGAERPKTFTINERSLFDVIEEVNLDPSAQIISAWVPGFGPRTIHSFIGEVPLRHDPAMELSSWRSDWRRFRCGRCTGTIVGTPSRAQIKLLNEYAPGDWHID